MDSCNRPAYWEYAWQTQTYDQKLRRSALISFKLTHCDFGQHFDAMEERRESGPGNWTQDLQSQGVLDASLCGGRRHVGRLGSLTDDCRKGYKPCRNLIVADAGEPYVWGLIWFRGTEWEQLLFWFAGGRVDGWGWGEEGGCVWRDG